MKLRLLPRSFIGIKDTFLLFNDFCKSQLKLFYFVGGRAILFFFFYKCITIRLNLDYFRPLSCVINNLLFHLWTAMLATRVFISTTRRGTTAAPFIRPLAAVGLQRSFMSSMPLTQAAEDNHFLLILGKPGGGKGTISKKILKVS